MQKVFMTAKEVQDFLEVSRTTAYQLINEMNQELMNLGYRVQRGKVNRQYFMEKYCYGKELRREVQKWVLIEMKTKMVLGIVSSAMLIGKGKS